MKTLAITLLLSVVLVAVPGCPRHWAHAAVAGAAVGVIAADAIHHTRYHGDYYHRGPDVSVTYGAPDYHHSTTYYPGYQNYYPAPRVVYYAPRPTRVVRYVPRPRGSYYYGVRRGY